MNRHRKLIRLVLTHVRDTGHYNDAGFPDAPFPEFDCYNRDEVKYHIELCQQAGFLSAGRMDGRCGMLTWEGHEYLDGEQAK